MESDSDAQDNVQNIPTTLETLTPEEKQADLYITAIHELNRLRYRWVPNRCDRVAADLGLNPDQLRLTWCLLQAIERTRHRSLGVRQGVEKSYLNFLHGTASSHLQDPTESHGSRTRVSNNDIREATEALLAASNSELDRRNRVAALLNGRQLELQIREDVEYESDVSLSSDEEDHASLLGISMRAVKQLPNTEDLPPEKLSSIASRVATLAEALKQGGMVDGVSQDTLRMTKQRTEALRWLSQTDSSRNTLTRRRTMAEDVDSISEEADVRLHPVTKRALTDAFTDEESLSEGGLHAFRALVPETVYAVVKARGVRRLVGWMKSGDQDIAEKLIGVFGSARRCLRAGVNEVCKIFEEEGTQVMERLHGFDEALHGVLKDRVVAVWLVSRVMKDKFGGLLKSRERGLGEFVDGSGEVVDLCMDERLSAYQAVHERSEGVDRERFEVSWGLFRAVCIYTKVEDCVSATRSLLDEWNMKTMKTGACLLRKTAEEDVWSMCVRLGIDNDEALRLKRYATNNLVSANMHHQLENDKYCDQT